MLVDKLAIVVLKPEGVDLAMVAPRWQIFTVGAMKMDAHRHRLSACALDHPNCHRAMGRGNFDKLRRWVVTERRQIIDMVRISAGGDIEFGLGMGGIFHNDGLLDFDWLHHRFSAQPAGVIIIEGRARRDDHAEIDL